MTAACVPCNPDGSMKKCLPFFMVLATAITGFAQGNTPVVTSGTATGTVNVAFSYQIVAVAPSQFPVTGYGATGLPAGLNVNTSTGLISGTPTAAGTYNVTISATNSKGTGN